MTQNNTDGQTSREILLMATALVFPLYLACAVASMLKKEPSENRQDGVR